MAYNLFYHSYNMIISIITGLSLFDPTIYCFDPVRNRKSQNFDFCFDFSSDPLWYDLDMP
ncbi:hypothetical protein Hanom_Chr11g01032991 [Helianthus anomalus]